MNSTDAVAPPDERAIFHRSPAFGRSMPPSNQRGEPGSNNAPFDEEALESLVDSELNSQHALPGVVHSPSAPECTHAPTVLPPRKCYAR